MINLATYLAQDRRRALAHSQTLPDRAHGSVLFADISGFTPFTEALRHAYGSRRGAEELSKHLDAVYTALIAEVERYGGSVTGFAGDAITCWFDEADGSAPSRAVACAVALQTAMQAFAAISLPEGEVGRLTIKVGLATGEARRLAAGDETHYWLDVLAGETVNRAAVAEQLAAAPEILLDETTIQALDEETITLTAWRVSDATGQRFGVLGAFASTVNPFPRLPLPELDEERTRLWLDPLVYEQEKTGYALLQTDFRPCVALFVRFTGIDYEAETAADQLNQFIRPLQAILAHYEGTLIDLTFGDKGSYAYINFGALSIHEDDARRAVKTALRLQEVAQTLPFLEPLQIGITSGVMRAGAYGGVTRRHYGALGDEVNLAARLMSKAALGEVLVSKRVQTAIAADFAFVAYPVVQFKGKAEPVPVFAVAGQQKRRAMRLQEPTYALPMVGREAELQQIAEKLELAAEGKSQVIGIVAEAGLGKSRLVAEVARAARQQGFAGYGGACQLDAISTPYHVWKSIWQAFFNVDPEMPLPQLLRHLEGEIEARAPWRVAAVPLLNVLLGVNIPENEFTRLLEPKTRQSALHALLEDCLKAAAQVEPMLIVIEDLNWIDALSHDLLEQLAKATASLPICFALAYRPPQLARLAAPRLESLPQFTRIELQSLTASEAEQAIRAKLAQLYPLRDGDLPDGLAEALMARAQGNPFYLEELLNYIHDRGLDPTELDRIELPDSLHTLILSRIDQLSEREKSTLRAAGIIGRLFPANWLMGYYPELGAIPQVKESLEQLDRLDITPLESPEPELTYLFKHIVTHEVTYESLPFATRAQLHERLAAYLERVYAEVAPLETLAFHYGHSNNTAKQIEYLRRAGEAAQKNFAGDAALEFYGALLPLLSNDPEKLDIHLQRGQALELLGQWDEAESDYRAALELAHDNAAQKAVAQLALGKLNSLRGEYEVALNWLVQAREIQLAFNDSPELTKTLIETGVVLWRQGNYVEARERLNEGLAAAQEMDDTVSVSLALHNLGNLAASQGDYAAAQALFERSLGLRRELGDKGGITNSLRNLGLVTLNLGAHTTGRALLKESLNLAREMGDKQSISGALNNLGVVALRQGDYATAQALYEESLNLRLQMGEKRGIAVSLNNLGLVAGYQGDYAAARALYEESLSLRREMGDKQGINSLLHNLAVVAFLQGDYTVARALHEECLSLRRELGEKRGVAESLNNLGYVNLAQEDTNRAFVLFVESLTLNQEMGFKSGIIGNLIGLAAVAEARGDNGRSVHLAAATETLRVDLGEILLPVQRGVYEKTVTTTRAALGEEAFAAGWAKGERWSLEEAAAYALEETADHA
jgi:adenylate cyclase